VESNVTLNAFKIYLTHMQGCNPFLDPLDKALQIYDCTY